MTFKYNISLKKYLTTIKKLISDPVHVDRVPGAEPPAAQHVGVAPRVRTGGQRGADDGALK